MELSSLLLLLPLLLGFLYLTKVWAAGRNARRLPPSPRGLPLIGNLHQVGALPHRALRALAATHGAPDLMGLHLGQVPAVVASSPAAAAALMREHDDAFGTRPYFRTAEILTYGFQDLVFAPHGEHWRHVRRLCSAHVLSAVRSHSFDGMRQREVAALVRTIRERASSSAGGVVDVSKALYGFANGVICRAVSGTGRLSREEEDRRSELFRALIEENTALLGGFCIGDYFPSLAWADSLSGASTRAWRNFKRWDDVLEKVVQEHEARRRGDGEEEDFVDVLLALQAEEKQDDGFELTRDAIKSLLADMFAAGTETSFITLEWAMSELVRSPAAMERLKNELRAAAPGSSTVVTTTTPPYLRAVVKEALRLHPPVPLLLPRECMRDTTVLGLPRGPRHPRVRQRLGGRPRPGVVERARRVPPREVLGQRRGLPRRALPVRPVRGRAPGLPRDAVRAGQRGARSGEPGAPVRLGDAGRRGAGGPRHVGRARAGHAQAGAAPARGHAGLGLEKKTA